MLGWPQMGLYYMPFLHRSEPVKRSSVVTCILGWNAQAEPFDKQVYQQFDWRLVWYGQMHPPCCKRGMLAADPCA